MLSIIVQIVLCLKFLELCIIDRICHVVYISFGYQCCHVHLSKFILLLLCLEFSIYSIVEKCLRTQMTNSTLILTFVKYINYVSPLKQSTGF
jgi:hypothetical protein